MKENYLKFLSNTCLLSVIFTAFVQNRVADISRDTCLRHGIHKAILDFFTTNKYYQSRVSEFLKIVQHSVLVWHQKETRKEADARGLLKIDFISN
jgi:predicted XRE-type DNA-binding protein